MNRIALTLAALCTVGGAAAQTAPAPTLVEVSTKAREARLKGDIPTWLDFARKSLALTPDHPDILISVARAHAAAVLHDQALHYLEEAARRGAAIDAERFVEFKPIASSPRFQLIADRLKHNAAAVSQPVVVADLPDRESEGIAYDPVSQRLFTGTADGNLLAVSMDGAVAPFASGDGLRQVLGVKVDAARRRLWVVNGRYPDVTYTDATRPADTGTGGVRAYDLDSGQLVAAVERDDRPDLVHGFNDLVIAPDGGIFVTDTNTSAVYHLAPGGQTLELFLRDQRMTFPNGIAASPDGRTIYVAHTEGLSAIDVATKARTLLPVPADGSVNSIDGLLLAEGIFYGVQNSPYMNRIVAAALARDGKSIARVWSVSAHAPAEYSKTTAAIAGRYLYMVGGTPMPDIYGGTNAAKPTRKIWRVALEP